jgi:hypothetical protein
VEAVWVALIVAGVGLLGQWLLKRQDFARQDQVAERVATAAAQAAQAAELLAVQNERVAAATEITNKKLEQVHVIVNQQRTDMQRYQATLIAALIAARVPIPPDVSLDK